LDDTSSVRVYAEKAIWFVYVRSNLGQSLVGPDTDTASQLSSSEHAFIISLSSTPRVSERQQRTRKSLIALLWPDPPVFDPDAQINNLRNK
jgi:hypothetical protein